MPYEAVAVGRQMPSQAVAVGRQMPYEAVAVGRRNTPYVERKLLFQRGGSDYEEENSDKENIPKIQLVSQDEFIRAIQVEPREQVDISTPTSTPIPYSNNTIITNIPISSNETKRRRKYKKRKSTKNSLFSFSFSNNNKRKTRKTKKKTDLFNLKKFI
jgi:hypothetical protein